ncbi:MAG: exonuclease domain-containing protein [Gemmatimonadaceae bacterium]
MGLSRGVYAEPQDTLLTSRAADYLAAGPADVVDLIGHICSLPGAPRIVAEHMAHAIFAGRRDFVQTADGRWQLSGPVATGSHAPAQATPIVEASTPGFSYGRPGFPASEFESSRPRRRSVAVPSEPLRSLSYVVVDVETTGGRANYGDRITEIAAVVVRDNRIVEMFETLVNPERSIPYFVSQLTNITWDMVRDAPTFDRVAPDVMRVLEGNVFVAHNAMFDWRFVGAELSRSTNQRLRGRKLCTVGMARKVLPQLPRRSLDHIARYYGVEITGRHRAGGDALATARCLIRMLDDLSDRGCDTWEDLDALLRRPSKRRKKRRPPALPTPVTRDTTA